MVSSGFADGVVEGSSVTCAWPFLCGSSFDSGSVSFFVASGSVDVSVSISAGVSVDFFEHSTCGSGFSSTVVGV